MADPRVAVYIDFDNIVISRYDQLFGSGSWRKDNARDVAMNAKSSDAVAQRLDEARVDIGAILEYATSFGSVSVIRAYADWSAPANASYKLQLVDHSVDLTQLFNVSGTKNGADIRLAVDVIDDLFRFESISHVLVVAGDSDYIPLVTRCKRMGREVIGPRHRRFDVVGVQEGVRPASPSTTTCPASPSRRRHRRGRARRRKRRPRQNRLWMPRTLRRRRRPCWCAPYN